MFAPHLAWRDADVPARISARVNLPVVMDHDVNSAAWAEYRRGAAAGAPIALLIALGTGIGAGLIIDGEIYRGAHGVAPELGHLTVVPDGRDRAPAASTGCWERYCSGTALAETARHLMTAGDAPVLRSSCDDDPDAITGTMVAVAATEGDPAALAAMDELGRWLAAGLALVTDVLDPEVIVIGGGVASAAGMFLPLAVSEFAGHDHRGRPPAGARVELARFGDRAGIIGAALMAADADRSRLTRLGSARPARPLAAVVRRRRRRPHPSPSLSPCGAASRPPAAPAPPTSSTSARTSTRSGPTDSRPGRTTSSRPAAIISTAPIVRPFGRGSGGGSGGV